MPPRADTSRNPRHSSTEEEIPRNRNRRAFPPGGIFRGGSLFQLRFLRFDRSDFNRSAERNTVHYENSVTEWKSRVILAVVLES